MIKNKTCQTKEKVLNYRLEIIDGFSDETIAELEDLRSDLSYISQSLESTQTRFSKMLDENRQLKTLLWQMVGECWCTPGNRCVKCQRILLTLDPLNR